MPASKHTPNMNLPLYNSGDHFSVLGDMNNAMTTIDSTIGTIKTSSSNAERDATSALKLANTANDAVTRMQEGDKGALAIAQQANNLAENVSAKADALDSRVSRVENTASSSANTASSANDTARRAESAVNSVRGIAEQAQRTASSYESRIAQAEQNASNAKNAVADLDKQHNLRKSVTTNRDLGSTSTASYKATLLATLSIFLNEGDTINVMSVTRSNRGSLSPAYGVTTGIYVSLPGGGESELNWGQGYAGMNISTLSEFTATKTGNHTLNLYGGVLPGASGSINWGSTTQTITTW